MNLRIFSWNARSIRKNLTNNKFFELKFHLQSNFYHLILIQETWLDQNCSISLPGYSCVRHDHVSLTKHPHGGVLIFIHKSVPFRKINFVNLKYSDAVFIRVSFGFHDVIVGSVYSSPSLKTEERKADFVKLLSRPGPFFLAGDFNAKHIAWNNVKGDRSGSHLHKLCIDNLCDMHFTDSPTAFPSNGPPSFLDIAITKNIEGVFKPVTINDLSSDHLPVVFEVPIFISNEEQIKIPCYAKANWKEYRRHISFKISSLISSQEFSLKSSDEIDLNIETLQYIIRDASKLSIPAKKTVQIPL